VYPSRRHLSPRVRAVMDFLLETFAANPVLADPARTG
jgi:DNA-binding transcriptional LysR family regulator